MALVLKVEVLLFGNHVEYFYYRCNDLDGGFLTTFKSSLLQRHNIVNENPFKMSWYDNEGDKISVHNESDWLILMEVKAKKLIIEINDTLTSASSVKTPEINDDNTPKSPITINWSTIDCDETMTIRKTPIVTASAEKLDISYWQSSKAIKEIERKDLWVVSPLTTDVITTPIVCPSVKRKGFPNDNTLPNSLHDNLISKLETLESHLKFGSDNKTDTERVIKKAIRKKTNADKAEVEEEDIMVVKKAAQKRFRTKQFLKKHKIFSFMKTNPISDFKNIKQSSLYRISSNWVSKTPKKHAISESSTEDIEGSRLAKSEDTTLLDSASPIEASLSPVEASLSPVEASLTPIEASPNDHDVSELEIIEESQLELDLSFVPEPAPAPAPTEPATLDYFHPEVVCMLLSMGFKNDDGFLTRLVQSCNGNIDHALNVLVPN